MEDQAAFDQAAEEQPAETPPENAQAETTAETSEQKTLEVNDRVRVVLVKNYLGDFTGKRMEMTRSRAEKLVAEGFAEWDPFPSDPVAETGPVTPKLTTEQAFGKGKK